MCMTKVPTPNSSAIMLSIEPTIVCLRIWALLVKANNLFSNAPIILQLTINNNNNNYHYYYYY